MALCPATAETIEKLLQYSKEDHNIEKCPCHICQNIAADRARTGQPANAVEETIERTENDIEELKRRNRELYRAAHPPILGSPFNSSQEASSSPNSSTSSNSSSSPNSSTPPTSEEEEATTQTINGFTIHKNDRLNLEHLNKLVGEIEQHGVNGTIQLARQLYARWAALADARSEAFLSGWLQVDLVDYGVYTIKADPGIRLILDRKNKVDAEDLIMTLEHGWLKEFVRASRPGHVESSASSSSLPTNDDSNASKRETRQRSNSSALSSSSDSDSAVSVSSTHDNNDPNTSTNTNTNTTQTKKNLLTCACHPLATSIRKQIATALAPIDNDTPTVWALQKIIDDTFAKTELFWTLHRSDRQGVYPHGFFIYQSRLKEVLLRRFADIPPLLRGEGGQPVVDGTGEGGSGHRGDGSGQRAGGGGQRTSRNGRNGHVRVDGHRRGVRGRRAA